MNVCGIHLALNDVQDGNVTTLFAGHRRNHAVLGLEQTSHDVENSSLANCLCLLYLVTGKWRVGGHEEVATWGWYQGGENAN